MSMRSQHASVAGSPSRLMGVPCVLCCSAVDGLVHACGPGDAVIPSAPRAGALSGVGMPPLGAGSTISIGIVPVSAHGRIVAGPHRRMQEEEDNRQEKTQRRIVKFSFSLLSYR